MCSELLCISTLDFQFFTLLYKKIFLIIGIFLVFFFFNCSSIYFLMNIYSDSSQIALKYLENTKANINNILIMTSNFNIRNNIWNSLFSHYSVHSDTLMDIVDSLNICLSKAINQAPTRYADNPNKLNSVIDLMFL